jgi:sugar-specific transcriptional regulator TrmB
MKEKALNLLSELGFNGAEAAAYLALLKEPGATGYRVSRIIGKPVPNTYKALDSLKEKGAAMLDDSNRGRAYVAVPIAEYLEAQKRNLDAKKKQLEAELASEGAAPAEGGIYQLNSAEQVLAKARAMLESARSVVLVDVYPRPLAVIKADLARAAKRGVHVMVETYAPAEIEGCEVICPKKAMEDINFWKGDWLNMTTDWSQHMYSLLDTDGVGCLRAVWSRDVYLSVMAFNGMLNEMMLRRVGQMMSAGLSREEIHKEAQRISRHYLKETPFESVAKQWRNPEPVCKPGDAKKGKK